MPSASHKLKVEPNSWVGDLRAETPEDIPSPSPQNSILSTSSSRSTLKKYVYESSREQRKASCWQTARTFFIDFVNVYKLEANARVADFTLSRLKFYTESLQQAMWSGVTTDRISGIWEVIALLNEMSYEFESRRGVGERKFGTQLILEFEKDVKNTLGEKFLEHVKWDDGKGKGKVNEPRVNYSPWTEKGRQYEIDMVNFLKEANADCEGLRCPDPRFEGSLDNAISFLKPERKAKFEKDTGTVWSEEDVEAYKERICDRLLRRQSKEEWWAHAPLPRAFSIGMMKDLWDGGNYKALQYILQEADNIDTTKIRNDADEASNIPFHWTRGFVTLAGPHLAKFKGDSDSIAQCLKGFQCVRFATLPRFSYELLDFNNDVKARVKMVWSISIQIFSLLIAASLAFFNAVMRKWSPLVVVEKVET